MVIDDDDNDHPSVEMMMMLSVLDKKDKMVKDGKMKRNLCLLLLLSSMIVFAHFKCIRSKIATTTTIFYIGIKSEKGLYMGCR